MSRYNKYKLILISLFSIILPYLEFVNLNYNNINSSYLRVLSVFIIELILLAYILSFVIAFFFKKKIFEIFYLFSIAVFFIFHYNKIKILILYLIQSNTFSFLGEISTLLIFIIIFVFFLFYKRKNLVFTNFVNLYVILLFFLNIIHFIPSYNNIQSQVYTKDKLFSDETYFSSSEIENIRKNQDKNKNIYYIVVDEAFPLEIYSENFRKLEVDKIINNYKKYNFHYIKDSNASYDTTALALSNILNLNYFINENTGTYIVQQLFPHTFSMAGKSPLVKHLKEINYDFYWVGNSIANCNLFNISLCLPDNNSDITFKDYLMNYISLINSNYILHTFLQKTPFISFTNKIFLNAKSEYSPLGRAYIQNDSINTFLKFSENLIKNDKRYFVLIHAILPHGYHQDSMPLIYNEDCSRRNLSTSEGVEATKELRLVGNKIKVDYGYETNYLCMLKRIDEFIKFINTHDPEAVVFIQGDHGALGKLRHRVFALGKVGSKCEKYLSKRIDNINAVRLSLSCATNQKVKLLEQKSFEHRGDLKQVFLKENEKI